MKKGKVYIMGAGCGEYDLITVRGMRLLEKCDAVVYDALIDTRLIGKVDKKADKICVGKRSGKHSALQEEINDIIIKLAQEGKTVVRLKGGDPLVFGRGGEEAAALKEKGIYFEFVPGVSSCIAVPELAGIPITHRGISRNFRVVTAHTKDEDTDFKKYADDDGTLVLLMGLAKIEEITSGLIEGGMREDTAAAVISDGGFPGQKKIIGTVGNIAKKCRAEKMKAPAIIVIGESVNIDLSCEKSGNDKVLSGVSAALTGTGKFTQKISKRLEEYGAFTENVLEMKVIENEDMKRLDDAICSISRYNYIVFTSANGAEIFFERMKKLKRDIREMCNIKIAVIGRGTADYLEDKGIFAQIMPSVFTSEALGEILAENVGENERVLIARALNGSHKLNEILDKNNIKYDDIKTYDIKADKDMGEVYHDYIVFASRSGVNAFFESGGKIGENTDVVCIGDITAKAAEKNGIRRYITAEEFSADGIIKKITEAENEKIQKTSHNRRDKKTCEGNIYK